MDLSYARSNKNDVDIPIYIGDTKCIIRLDKGFFTPVRYVYAGLHNHSVYEIHFILSGCGTIYIHNRYYPLSAGDICFLSPGVYHYHYKNKDETYNMQTIKLIIPDAERKKSCLPLQGTEEILEVLISKKFAISRSTFDSQQLLFDILNELEEKAAGYLINIQARFMLLIANLVRSIAESDYQVSTSRESIPEEIRNEIIDMFFYNNYHRNVTADDLAELVNTSRRQLYRILKQLYNMSFKQKLLENRVEVAKDLLKNSSLSIQSISEKVGYPLLSNFYCIFRQKTGMTPARFRASNR